MKRKPKPKECTAPSTLDVKYHLSPAQYDFLTATEKQVGAVSGLGSGKTFVLILNMIVNEILPYPNATHCFAGLSFQQLTDVSQPMFESFLDELHIPWTKNISTRTYEVNYHTKVIFRSLDQADRMRSVEIGSLSIEELSYAKEADFLTFLGRLRDKNGSLRFRTVFTPNGRNHAYHYFITKSSSSKRLIRMSTFDNKHLPQEYISMLQESYDEHMQQQELHGQFITTSEGSCYYMFSAEKHVHDFPEQKPTHFGMDFNVNPLTGVAGFIKDGVIYIQDEMFLKNSNTYEAAEYILDNFGRPTILPDSTGSARRSSSTQSDHQILSSSGLKVERTRNPLVKDRYNCVNNLLSKGKIVIHPRCKQLIKDLEQMTYDNKDPMLSHISDAFGYLCWYFFPLQRERKSFSEQL